MITSTLALRPAIGFLLSACLLAGCGGTKVLKESQPIQTTKPLAAASDRQVSATLDWVVVRDGPGTWAKNADWDEYLLTVNNQSEPVDSGNAAACRGFAGHTHRVAARTETTGQEQQEDGQTLQEIRDEGKSRPRCRDNARQRCCRDRGRVGNRRCVSWAYLAA